MESLACGTPVVTTRGTALWSELAASGGAEVAEPNHRAIAEAIQRVAFDPQRRETMGRQGRSWVMQSLATDRVLARYEAAYRNDAANGDSG